MKAQFLKLVLMFVIFSNAQTDSLKTNKIQGETRNILWVLPSKTEQINGIALSGWSVNWDWKGSFDETKLKVNGLNLEGNPLGFMFLMYLPESHFMKLKTLKEENTNYNSNGLSLSFFGNISVSEQNGASLGGIWSVSKKTNGITLAGLITQNYTVNGLSIAPINVNNSTNGIQIGVFNKSTKLKGFQFGIWNQNQCGNFPLMNFCFKS